MSVALLYALFAGGAAALNLGTQWAVSSLWPWGLRNLAALVGGTGAGLVVKYLLDKRWIFRFRPPSLADDARRFLLYVCTGAATTALFWGVELLFVATLGTPWAPYAGGAVGLCAGYATKYVLDCAFVFATGKAADAVPRNAADTVSGTASGAVSGRAAGPSQRTPTR
jgi:putative flippase GtrA